jgi:hypothetical protein
MSTLESDEAFARQLQAQEMGFLSLHINANDNTPLMAPQQVRCRSTR